MLIIISPAKTLDFESASPLNQHSQPLLLEQSQQLIDILRGYSPLALSKLMKISDKLGQLNADRYHQWQLPFTTDNAKQAVYAFKGDVYTGLDSSSLNASDMQFAQQHLRILSGLYGLLRPLDLIQAYRLEMGTRLANPHGDHLYAFWGDMISQHLNHALSEQGDDLVINLASNEYSKAVRPKALQGRILTPVFKEYKQGAYKVIGIHAKKARGLMSRYIIEHQLDKADDLKHFDHGGYAYQADLSNDKEWVFTRQQ